MVTAMKLVFKELTPADFFWINQPGLKRGGGQSYIDFDTSDISLRDWKNFFAGCDEGRGASGPHWSFSVQNLGAGDVQHEVKLGQRRSTSFSIRSQKLPEHSSGGKRLHAWSPHFGMFPAIPAGLTSADQVPFELIAQLRIFLIRDDAGKFWAGWTRLLPPGCSDPRFIEMFESKSGIINLKGDYEIDASNPNWPFKKPADALNTNDVAAIGEAVVAPQPVKAPEALPGDDEGLWDPADDLDMPQQGISYSQQKIRKRNQAAARVVRKLYSQCQITGSAFVFQTTSGKPYLEVHHLIPLGLGGADSPHNMIVVSALAHKMLHYANVSAIDLGKIHDNTLQIVINGQPATITWHPQHAELVLAKNSS